MGEGGRKEEDGQKVEGRKMGGRWRAVIEGRGGWKEGGGGQGREKGDDTTTNC
jgi:hypothetical protein